MELNKFLAYLGWSSAFGSLWAALITTGIKNEIHLGIYIFTFAFSLIVAFVATNLMERNDVKRTGTEETETSQPDSD